MPKATSAHRAKQSMLISSYSPVVSIVGSTVATQTGVFSPSEEKRRLDLTLKVSVSDISVHYLLPVDFAIPKHPYFVPNGDLVIKYPTAPLRTVDVVTPWSEVRLPSRSQVRANLNPAAANATLINPVGAFLPYNPLGYFPNPVPAVNNLPQPHSYIQSSFVPTGQQTPDYQQEDDLEVHDGAELEPKRSPLQEM